MDFTLDFNRKKADILEKSNAQKLKELAEENGKLNSIKEETIKFEEKEKNLDIELAISKE
jgi:hypothetical protein